MREHIITVIGAGHGGKAMAAELASRGFVTRLYNRTFQHIETIAHRGGIELGFWDGRTAFGGLEMATSELDKALDGAKLIMVVVPASGHYDIAAACAPHLRDGQVIVLNPGRTGGALEFRQVLQRQNCAADVVIAEVETFLFAARSMGPAEAHIFRRKNSVPLAALPAAKTPLVLSVLKDIYPQFIDGCNVLYTSLNNMGAIFHPALTLLNAGWIEHTEGEFQFYIEGVTPSIARMLERLDRERVTVAMAMGVRARWDQQGWQAKRLWVLGGDAPKDRDVDNPKRMALTRAMAEGIADGINGTEGTYGFNRQQTGQPFQINNATGGWVMEASKTRSCA